MNPFQIKICGVTTPRDACHVVNCEADAIGLNFYPPSPRFVTDTDAAQIVAAVRENIERKQQLELRQNLEGNHRPIEDPLAGFKIVGVFVDLPVDQIMSKTRSLKLNGIQLHGDEDPAVVAEIKSRLSETNLRCDLIRAVRTKPATSGRASDVNEIQDQLNAWVETGIDAILLDAAVPGEFGGTGETVDWKSVPSLACNTPLVLAGGLDPDNVASAIEISQVSAVDVASGVESRPGQKSLAKVAAFIAAAKTVFRD